MFRGGWNLGCLVNVLVYVSHWKTLLFWYHVIYRCIYIAIGNSNGKCYPNEKNNLFVSEIRQWHSQIFSKKKNFQNSELTNFYFFFCLPFFSTHLLPRQHHGRVYISFEQKFKEQKSVTNSKTGQNWNHWNVRFLSKTLQTQKCLIKLSL